MSRIDAKTHSKAFTGIKYEDFSLYENYSRVHGLLGKGFTILMAIYNSERGITQRDICNCTFSTKQVVNAAIKNWLDEGYVYLTVKEDDRRTKAVMMTEKGREYASKILDPLAEAEVIAMKTLKSHEQKQLIELYTKYNCKLRELLEGNH